MLHFAIIIVNLRISSRFLGGTRDKRGRLLVRETYFFHLLDLGMIKRA